MLKLDRESGIQKRRVPVGRRNDGEFLDRTSNTIPRVVWTKARRVKTISTLRLSPAKAYNRATKKNWATSVEKTR